MIPGEIDSGFGHQGGQPGNEIHRLEDHMSGAVDVIVYIGQALFVRCRNSKEIRHELGEKNIGTEKVPGTFICLIMTPR